MREKEEGKLFNEESLPVADLGNAPLDVQVRVAVTGVSQSEWYIKVPAREDARCTQ